MINDLLATLHFDQNIIKTICASHQMANVQAECIFATVTLE